VRYLARRPKFRSAVDQIVEPYFAALAGVLKRGRELGLMKFDNTASMVEAVHMLCSGWAMGTGVLAKTDRETYWQDIAAIIEGRFFVDGTAQS
jgi:hypothetical protein